MVEGFFQKTGAVVSGQRQISIVVLGAGLCDIEYAEGNVFVVPIGQKGRCRL